MNPLQKYTDNIDYKKLWHSALSSPLFLALFAVILTIGLVLMSNLPHFLLYKESISGMLLWDPITSYFDPIDFNPWIFYLTTFFIIIGKLSSIFTPRSLIHMMATMAFLNIVRMGVLYLVNLDAPVDIIPLYDPFLECTFYKDVLITKDLFFSGHTSNIVVFGFLTQVKWMKNVFFTAAFIVASMLVLQHVHYTIDVVVAPIFAYGVYKLCGKLIDMISMKYYEKGKQKKYNNVGQRQTALTR